MQRNRGEKIEWERLGIFSIRLEIPREHFMQNGHNKGRNDKNLTKAEEIKNSWQEYTEELY